jgi:hypothetical protein
MKENWSDTLWNEEIRRRCESSLLSCRGRGIINTNIVACSASYTVSYARLKYISPFLRDTVIGLTGNLIPQIPGISFSKLDYPAWVNLKFKANFTNSLSESVEFSCLKF